MRKFLASLPVVILSIVSVAQKRLPAFGEIDPAEMTLKSCLFEPDAPAMKLFDVQETEFNIFSDGARLKTERRVRIKIFNEKGYKHATVKIPYLSKKGIAKIKQLRAVIYNLDPSGKIVTHDLGKKDFFKEKAMENVGIVNFTFPGLQPGSVIEFSYTLIESHLLHITPWFIQGDIPVLYAATSIQVPAVSVIEKKIWGIDSLTEIKQHIKFGNLQKTIFYKENIVSFKAEPYMSSLNDNLMRVTFLLFPRGNIFRERSTRSIWEGAGSSLLVSSSFGQQIKKTIPGTESIIDSAKAILPAGERIAFIFEKVKTRIPNRSEQTYHPDDLIEAWNSRSGNTADINLILLNLLQKTGIEAYPLLISTRDNGKVNTQFPSMGQINGVDVLAIDSNRVFILDASLKFQSSQNPPFNILNRNAFLLNETNMRWIFVDDNRPLLKETIQVNSLFKEEGSLEGMIYSTYHDYAKSYLLDTTIEENDPEKFPDKKPLGLTIKSVTRENVYADTKPLQQKAEFVYEPQQTGDFYFINPQVFFSKRDNPFLSEARNTDIDFGCQQELTLKLNLSIPAKFQVDFIPKSIIIRAPDTSFIFRRNVVSDADGILLQQTLEIKKPVFYKEEYPGIQEFFKKIYALMMEEIVLKRKS